MDYELEDPGSVMGGSNFDSNPMQVEIPGNIQEQRQEFAFPWLAALFFVGSNSKTIQAPGLFLQLCL